MLTTPHHGALVEAAIRKSGYSLTKLAAELGMSRSTLYRRFEVPVWSDTLLLKTRALLPGEFHTALEGIDVPLPTHAKAKETLVKSYQTFVGLLASDASKQEVDGFEKAFLQFSQQKRSKLSKQVAERQAKSAAMAGVLGSR